MYQRLISAQQWMQPVLVKTMALLFLLGMNLTVLAQSTSKKPSISIGYLGHLAVQPGLRIGTQLNLKEWSRGESSSITRQLFVRPQMGFYARRDIQTSYLANVDLGYKRMKPDQKRYSALSLSLGYWLQGQVTDLAIDLSDGSKQKTRAYWHWFFSTINYEFGSAITDSVGWYSKISLGQRVGKDRPRNTILFLELGLQFQLH